MLCMYVPYKVNEHLKCTMPNACASADRAIHVMPKRWMASLHPDVKVSTFLSHLRDFHERTLSGKYRPIFAPYPCSCMHFPLHIIWRDGARALHMKGGGGMKGVSLLLPYPALPYFEINLMSMCKRRWDFGQIWYMTYRNNVTNNVESQPCRVYTPYVQTDCVESNKMRV